MLRWGTWARAIRIGAVAVSLAGALAPSADAADLFGAPQRYDLAAYGRESVSADFNSDGNADVAVANGGSLVVRFGDGHGGFTSDEWTVQTPNGWSLATADFNRDGRPDLVTGAWINTIELMVLINTGSGFTVQSVHPGSYNGFYPSIESIAIIDSNEDGWPDIAAAKGAGSVVVLRNAGGAFSVTNRLEITAAANSYAVAAGDLNRDGHADLVITGGSGTYRVLGDGQGRFGTPLQIGVTSPVVGVADLNGDHIVDVVLSERVLLGNGDGSFYLAATGFPVGVTNTTSSHPFGLDDFDGDGKVDLAYATQGGGGANVGTRFSPGRGDGTFGAAVNLGSQGDFGVTVADLNEDHKPDLISAGNGTAFYVRLNQRPDRTPPSIDIYRPAEGAHYPVGQWVQPSFSCIDDVDGFLFNCQGNANWPAAFDTSTPGEHTFTVRGTDNSGNTASKTVHYTVDALDLPPGRLIAYEGNDGLYFATDDATHAVRVGVPGRYSGGDFSPDGTQFAYSVSRPTYDGVESEIRIRNIDGSNDRRVLLQARGDVGLPRFSPDGTQLSYVSQNPDTFAQSVWTVAVSGGSPRQRTRGGGATAAYDWAPDGEHLVLNQSSDHAYGFDVALLDLRDDSITPLTDRPGNEIWGRYSVDGKRVYYIVNPGVPSGKVYQLWSIKPDGTDDQRVAALTGDRYGSFAFSPDGESLIYSTSGDQADLVRVDLATGTSTALTTTSGFSEYLSAWQGPRRAADQEAPVVEIGAPHPDGEANWFVSAPVTVSVHASDNRAVDDVTCRVDGDIVNLTLDGLGTTDASARFNVNGDGQRRVSCRAHDANANASAVADLDLAIDTTRPSVSCEQVGAARWYASDVTVSCTAADATSSLLDQGDAAFVLATDVPDGTTDSSATTPERDVCDRAGLCTKAGPFRFKVDRRSPSIVFEGDQPQAGEWHRIAPTVQARAVDANISTLTCSLDGDLTVEAAPSGADLLVSTPVDTDGLHELACTARDYSGRETLSRTTVRVDRQAPAINCGVPSGWSAQNPEVVCVSTDADSGLAHEADGRFVLTSAAAEGTEDPAAETESRSVCDFAGNCRVAGPYQVAVDRKLPTLLLTQLPNGSVGWWTTRATVDVSAADASLLSVECTVNGASSFTESAAGRTSIAHEISIVPEGRHTVGCSARDSVSHTSQATADVRLDQTPPIAPQLVSARTPDTTEGEAWFEDSVAVAAVDRGDPLLADGSPGSGTNPASLPAPQAYSTEGVFTVKGASSDLAGNRSLETTLVVRVDTGSPTSQLTCPQSPSLGSTATASFTDADTGSGLVGPASGTFAVDTTTAGAHQTQHQAVDRVGHVTSRSCAYTVVDRTAPTVTCGSSDGQWHNANVSITCTAEDAGGLASTSDASFTLATSVAANTTNGDATTGSRTVCDRASNCSAAGPILHNRIDRTAPTVAIRTNLVGVPDSAACVDEAGGSGIALCSNVDEATPVFNFLGIKILVNHKFTATARDRAGNVTTKTVTYTTLV